PRPPRASPWNPGPSGPPRVSCWAAASPDGPDPTTATFLPVFIGGGWGTTPSARLAGSTICSSTFLIVTASLLIARTQAASHGAGHSVPVNSGKLLVACS